MKMIFLGPPGAGKGSLAVKAVEIAASVKGIETAGALLDDGRTKLATN